MDYEEYKKYHEDMMANQTGSSITEIEVVLSTVPLGVFFLLWSRLYNSNTTQTQHFIISFILIVLPIICQITILSNFIHVIPFNMLLLFSGIVLKDLDTSYILRVLSNKIHDRKSYITNYRASTNMISVLCILAVDFTVFPRRFAKTETFGFGLMDLGVGCFICSNGLVSKNKTSKDELMKVLKSSAVLIMLGFTRLLSVKSTNYHEHTSEYGTHWNFFFTLGFCRILSYLVNVISYDKEPLYLSVFVGAFHQFLLYCGLQDWALNEKPRDSFLTANREGLTSLPGYVSLYFASVALGKVINKFPNSLTYKKVLTYLISMWFCLWLCTGICYSTVGISRKIINIGYIFWIIASAVNVMIQFVVVEIIINAMSQSMNKTKFENTPYLLECINTNGLFFFILANLLTGLVNITFQTLLLDKIMGFSIIAIYMIILCGVSFALKHRNLILKCW